MIFECAEEQQSAFRWVLHVAIQHISGDSNKDFMWLDISLQPLLEPFLNFVRSALRAEYFPVQIVFCGEMAKNHRLSNSCTVGDLPCSHAVEAVASKQFGSHFEYLLPAVRRCEPGPGNRVLHCKSVPL